jgi:hypothetical protein
MESAEPHTAGYHRAVFVIEAEIQGFLAVFADIEHPIREKFDKDSRLALQTSVGF